MFPCPQNMKKLPVCVYIIALAGIGMGISPSFAQKTYPTRTVRIIISSPPGGTSDVLLRPITLKLIEAWGQQVLMDNRGGASGIIGTELAAKAAPDGYTLLWTGAPLYINPSLFEKLPYDSIKDFAPITIIAAVPNVLALHPSMRATTVKQLIALAKSRPGQLNFTGSGNATPGHLAGELFKTMAGIDMVYIPYKGGAAGITAVMSGEVSLIFTSTGSVLPQAQAGRVRIIAITTLERLPLLPDTPTVSESGLPGYEAVSWWGLLAPAGIAPELVSGLNADVLKALKTRDVQDVFSSRGAIAIGNTPAQFTARIRQDMEKWAKVVKLSGAKVD